MSTLRDTVAQLLAAQAMPALTQDQDVYLDIAAGTTGLTVIGDEAWRALERRAGARLMRAVFAVDALIHGQQIQVQGGDDAALAQLQADVDDLLAQLSAASGTPAPTVTLTMNDTPTIYLEDA